MCTNIRRLLAAITATATARAPPPTCNSKKNLLAKRLKLHLVWSVGLLVWWLFVCADLVNVNVMIVVYLNVFKTLMFVRNFNV